jgi:hypothetical protein
MDNKEIRSMSGPMSERAPDITVEADGRAELTTVLVTWTVTVRLWKLELQVEWPCRAIPAWQTRDSDLPVILHGPTQRVTFKLPRRT